MISTQITTSRTSYWRIFRPVFVILFVYLAGNLFYAWKGFKDYASSEFFPSISLVSILWCVMVALTALLMLLSYRVIERICRRIGWELSIDHLFLYAGFILLFAILIWAVKKLIWPGMQLTLQSGLIMSILGAASSIIPTKYFRSRAERWMDIIQRLITPFVLVFGIMVVLSVPLTVYNTWQEIRTLMTGCACNNEQPLVTFVFDDIYESTYTEAKPFFDKQGEVACTAATVDFIGKKGRMTAGQIMALQDSGWEILAHSITHPDLTTLSVAEIEKELKGSKEALSSFGFKIVNFVYPFYRHNANARAIAKKYYRSARAGDEVTTGVNINPHLLRMYAMSAIDIERFDTLPALERLVDEAEKNKTWLMITAHNLTPYRKTMLNLLIDYIRMRGIRIVTINQGLDLTNKHESRIAELLFILNADSPMHLFRNVHIASQHLLGFLQNYLCD